MITQQMLNTVSYYFTAYKQWIIRDKLAVCNGVSTDVINLLMREEKLAEIQADK